jgi:hypothetical protein
VNTVDPTAVPVASTPRVHTVAPATGGATAATDDAARTVPPTRERVSSSRNAPHTMTPNASSGLPAVLVPLIPNTDNTRDRKPLTGAVTDGAVIAGRLRTGVAGPD